MNTQIMYKKFNKIIGTFKKVSMFNVQDNKIIFTILKKSPLREQEIQLIRVHVIKAVGVGEERVWMIFWRKETLVGDETVRFVPRQREKFVGFGVAYDLGTFVDANRTHLSLVEWSQHFILDVVDYNVQGQLL